MEWRDSRAAERQKLARAFRSALQKVAAYASDGGTYETSKKTEAALYRLRDKLSDALNWEQRLGDDYPPVPWELVNLDEELRNAVRSAPELASQARRAGAERQLAELEEQQREERSRFEATGLAGYTKELELMRRRRPPGVKCSA